MPNLVNIVRGAAAPTLKRGDVKPGMVFMIKDRGTKQYAHIGHNGRAYSVNIRTQELSSSDNDASTAVLLGTWKFNVDRTYRRDTRIGQAMKRSQVAPGEVFMVKGGEREYAHLGSVTKAVNGWLSVPLDNTDNHAVTRNGDSSVTVVGSFALDVTLTK